MAYWHFFLNYRVLLIKKQCLCKFSIKSTLSNLIQSVFYRQSLLYHLSYFHLLCRVFTYAMSINDHPDDMMTMIGIWMDRITACALPAVLNKNSSRHADIYLFNRAQFPFYQHNEALVNL